MVSHSLSSSRWEFRDATKRSAWHSAMVPGCVHLDLRRQNAIPDPFWGTNETDLQWIEDRDWQYRTRFDLPEGALGAEHIELVADGLDTVAIVRLNGQEIGRTENMFVGQRWDVKSLLRPAGNELTITFVSTMSYIRSERLDHRPKEINDPVGRCTVIRKQQCQFGWDWGPRFVTAGIWRDIRIEAWDSQKVESIRITQKHARGGVTLAIEPELARKSPDVACEWHLSLRGEKVASGTGTRIAVPNPELWWPNGHGEQPLYTLAVRFHDIDGRDLGSWTRSIGLRTIELDRHRDRWGETFQFVVNGRPIFAKGANWIPAHSFVARLSRADYARDLRSAAAANMNMIRVWGGGIYESEDFYDVCDELGLLVWQDFMFACTLYPADKRFVESVRSEAEYQVRRLRHRACLALWCGNNEIESINTDALKDPKQKRNYDTLFLRVLPEVVEKWDPVTPYWSSSPARGDGDVSHPAGEARGDTHFWDVWHARHPVEDYTKWRFRFVSEFGMQSFSSPATRATFCSEDDNNVFGPTMDAHQKNRDGNQIILDYVSRYYRFPEGQDALIYLSQLNQARCMQIGVEHWRRNMPRCMGALYWQLNDCWPVASWSSIEFTGRWKALHYAARRFFAPLIVSAQVIGTETVGISNVRHSTVSAVELYTCSDAPKSSSGRLQWDVFHVDGRVLLHGEKRVALRYGESVLQRKVDLSREIAKYGLKALFVRIALDVDGQRVSEDTVFLCPPRFLALARGETRVDLKLASPQEALLTFTSTRFQHRFCFDLPGREFEAGDNYFELYPGEARQVRVRLGSPATEASLRRSLVHQSLVDSY